jgi:hypothetical protein
MDFPRTLRERIFGVTRTTQAGFDGIYDGVTNKAKDNSVCMRGE